MKLTGALLIIIIIVLLFVLIKQTNCSKKPSKKLQFLDSVEPIVASSDTQQQINDQADNSLVDVNTLAPPGTPEARALAEQIEYASADTATAEVMAQIDQSCDGQVPMGSSQPFDRPDMDFNDWAMSQAVDQQAIKYHQEYIKELARDPRSNPLGRPLFHDSHDSYIPIPWLGLRRPQAVPVHNPTQIPDIDISAYSTKPTLTWGST